MSLLLIFQQCMQTDLVVKSQCILYCLIVMWNIMEKPARIAEISATVTGGYFSCSPCRSTPQICPARPCQYLYRSTFLISPTELLTYYRSAPHFSPSSSYASQMCPVPQIHSTPLSDILLAVPVYKHTRRFLV